jgi:hypothetical protein
LPLLLVMYSLFCPLPCLRTLLTLGANSSTPRRHGSRQNNESITNTRCNSRTPRRHGSGQNNENITNTRGKLEHSTYFVHFHVFMECSIFPVVLVMFSLFYPLPCLRGVLEFVPIVSNVLIILSTSMSWWSCGQNNETFSHTSGKLEHSTKTWKWTK